MNFHWNKEEYKPSKLLLSFQLFLLVLIIIGVGLLFTQDKWLPKLTNYLVPPFVATSFEECAALGNPIMESYPRQCRSGDKTFTEEIGNELEKTNLIQLGSPRPNQVIESPLIISGRARGTWFFEASFPVVLVNWDGLIIAQGIATAKENWMTTEFVPFEATLTFELPKDSYSNKGTLILRKDNPSALPEYDDALEIPVLIGQ